MCFLYVCTYFISGLLGAHFAAEALKAKGEPALSWYDGQLVDMADRIGQKLLPAFNTTTGLPCSRVSLPNFPLIPCFIAFYACLHIVQASYDIFQHAVSLPVSLSLSLYICLSVCLSLQIHLRHGINGTHGHRVCGDTTCTACAGTMIMEFASLSRVTGNREYEVSHGL